MKLSSIEKKWDNFRDREAGSSSGRSRSHGEDGVSSVCYQYLYLSDQLQMLVKFIQLAEMALMLVPWVWNDVGLNYYLGFPRKQHVLIERAVTDKERMLDMRSSIDTDIPDFTHWSHAISSNSVTWNLSSLWCDLLTDLLEF